MPKIMVYRLRVSRKGQSRGEQWSYYNTETKKFSKQTWKTKQEVVDYVKSLNPNAHIVVASRDY